MTNREVKKDKMGDDPPYLAVGTDVSAKYKGAFCEAKVRKVVRVVKCKVHMKNGGVAFVTDDQIKGNLRIGTPVEVKLPDKKEYAEASITSIKDLSQYTVVFDDGDITTLRRTALCLKSGRHFAESETLDQLPLTHPEHFSTPVIGASRRGRRRLGGNEDSSDEEGSSVGGGGGRGERQREADIGKVVCVEISEKKKVKDNWFPGLIVAPNAQDAVRIHVDEDYLVRSFKDGRYFTVPKKEATEFTREIGLRVDNPSLKLAVEKALVFLDKDELPPHWDRDLLFGLVDSDMEDDDDQLDSDSSDDEPREEKDHFVAQLYKFMDDRGTPINKGPVIQSRDVDLYRLFRVVHKLGGYNRVTNQNQWKLVTHKMNFGTGANTVNSVKHAYKKFLHSFEDFYRKLGCTMVNHPRSHRRPNSKSNRSLIRDRDRATPLMKESSSGCPSSSGVPASSGEANASRDMMDVKVEMKKEEVDDPSESRTSRKDTSVSRVSVNRDKPPGGFEAKRDRHVKEEAQRRERTRDKTCKDTGKDAKDIKDVKDIKDETIVPPVKKKVEETLKLKVDERPPKSSIGILAKFSYKKDKAGLNRDNEEKEKNRMNRVKKSLGKGSGLMERQKRTIKDTVKALAKTLGFGGKAAGNSIIGGVAASSTSTRKMSASTTTSGSGEDDDRKKPKEEVAVAPSVEKKRGSSGTRSSREDTVAAVAPVTTTPSHPPQPSTPPAPPPARKSSLSGEDRRSHSRASRSRRPEDEGSMEPVSVSSNPGETSDGLTLDIVSPHKWISVGDKLRVYYGPNHKSKVTYEAKVVATRQEGEGGEREYLVHYTGWNTRYDEWIRRNRIAENLAWNTPSGVSTGPPQQQQQAKEACSPGIHGGSSRNKSTPRRSSTRTSTRNTRANTDDSDSDKESDGGSESETEANSSSQNRSMRSRRILSDEEKKPALPSPGTKTRSNKKCKTDEEEEDVEKGKEKQEEEEDKKKLPLPEAERKSLRLSQRKKQEVEHEKRLGPESDSGSDSESQEDSKAKVLELIEPLDDVYEFKEPEPFTFSKQKKTISPPGPAVQKGKKNIGLFEDYDNLEEENEDINAAIQRVMDTCDENKMDLDLLDSNSSDSNSSDSNSMCEIMKKRLQSEINTYEGPKSKLKGKGEESPTPPMRTRRSSESKSGKLENKNGEEKGKLLVLRSKEEKVLDETPVEKLSEPVNCGPDSSLAATRSKKPDVDNPPRSKKIEFETSASSGKVKKPEIDTTSGNKSKKTADLESIPNPKVKKSLDIDTSSLKAKKSELENISTPKTKKSDADTNIITSPKSKKSDTGTVSCAKVKKSDSDNPILIGGKAKKSESDVSNKTKKSDISVVASAKAKKIDLETASSPKAKKSEVDINESSPGKVNKKLETPETNMKTRLKTESRCSSPGSKTRSKTELASSKTDLTLNKNESMLKEEVMEALSETNTEDNKQSESPLPSVKQEKPKPTVLESKPKVSLASKKPVLEVKLQNSSKAADPVALATKVSDNVEATILAVSSLITPAPPAISHSKPISNSEGDNSAAGLTKLSPALEPKKQDVLFSSSKTTPKTKLKVIPSLSLHKSHTDFSAQTDPLDVNKDKNILAPTCLPKLPDIPVLQRIDCVVPKTPIKREPIDPTKIDLIKVSPNMPQLEKIDTMDVVDIATPVKIEEKIEERSDLKFPPFQFEDVPETPEKIFLPAVDSESEVIVKPDTVAKPDKKIEFKMKPKTSSPSGFGKTERARKLVRQRLGEAESPTKTVGGKDKKPSQTTPQVKKYGPASKPDTSTSTDAVKTNIKPNANTDVETKDNPPVVVSKSKETSLLLVGKTQESPAIVAAKVTETSPVSSKNKDVPSSLSNKAKESSPILSIKNKETTTPVSTKGDDNTVSSPSRVKDTSPSLSVKIKDSPSPPVQIKNKDGSVIVSTKVKDYPAVVPNKNKDVLLVASKSKESTPICSSKCRASTPVLSSRTKESDLVQPTIVSSKGNENMDVPTKPEPSLLTLEIDTKPRDTTSSPSKGKLTADVKKTEVVEIKYEPEPIIDPKKEDTKKQKEELKLSNVLEANIKVEESTPTGTNKSSDPHTSEEADQSKTPEKGKEDVEKGKRKEDSDEDAAKREEKSKELSSVFEFDETLEDEIVDLESESYLAPSKRKLAALIDSPGSEFMSNKLAKLNELEKLKQKLFMDCSGEGEDLEEKVEVEDKSRTEAEGRPENVQLELTADESLEEEVDNTLLCKETIPGSPTPYQDELNMIMELPPTNSSSGASSSSSTANAVLDNTPPTTPESSLSPPRNDCPVVSSGSGVYAKMMLGGEDREEVGAESLKKGLTTPMKRRSSHTERSLKKRVKQSPRNPGAGSDSDDLSMSEPFSIFSPTTTDITKSKYSYFVELDPELDQAQRIAVVQQKLQDLRKEYMMYKQELVTIDRRRKKIRRRERENKKNNPPALPVTLPST